MFEDSQPEHSPEFRNRVADIEFNLFWRDLQQLPDVLPHEKILVGVERYLSDGIPKSLITEIPEQYKEALTHLTLSVEQHINDLCREEQEPPDLLFLHQQDYLIHHQEDAEIAIAFRLRDRGRPKEYLMTHEALFGFDGYPSLMTASADIEDPESFCLDAHFEKSALAAMQSLFARCLSIGDGEAWRETYIGHMLLENFPTPEPAFQDPVLQAAKAIESVEVIKHQHSKLHLALKTHSQGEVQAVVHLSPSHRKLAIDFAGVDSKGAP